MLIHAGLAAQPVILSTRDNGFVYSMEPLLSRYNYVIDRVTIDSVMYYLDASEPWLDSGGFPSGVITAPAGSSIAIILTWWRLARTALRRGR